MLENRMRLQDNIEDWSSVDQRCLLGLYNVQNTTVINCIKLPINCLCFVFCCVMTQCGFAFMQILFVWFYVKPQANASLCEINKYKRTNYWLEWFSLWLFCFLFNYFHSHFYYCLSPPFFGFYLFFIFLVFLCLFKSHTKSKSSKSKK